MSLPACIYNNDYEEITTNNIRNIQDDNVPYIPKLVLPNKPNMVNINRLEDINSRISERNLPSYFLQQQFSMRPISTKYSTMPILDGRAKPTVPIIYKEPYNISSTFNPGTSSPFVGYASNVNNESRLRNQFFGIQNCEQSVYVPKSTSDMYMVNVCGGKRNEPMLFPNLFAEYEMEPFNPNTMNVGQNFFENNTRVQLKDHPEKYSKKQHMTQPINKKL
jgi:hypothetical protein